MIYSATEQYIDLACSALKNGDVIVYPTDTLYGFGVDATNTEAIQRLNRLKGRARPLSIILESISQIPKYAKISCVTVRRGLMDMARHSICIIQAGGRDR